MGRKQTEGLPSSFSAFNQPCLVSVVPHGFWIAACCFVYLDPLFLCCQQLAVTLDRDGHLSTSNGWSLHFYPIASRKLQFLPEPWFCTAVMAQQFRLISLALAVTGVVLLLLPANLAPCIRGLECLLDLSCCCCSIHEKQGDSSLVAGSHCVATAAVRKPAHLAHANSAIDIHDLFRGHVLTKE